MGRLTMRAVLVLGLVAACGRSGTTRARDEAGAADAASATPAIPVVVRTLGKAALDGYGWRSGPGRAAFERALAAERAGDLLAVEREASAALAADPGHLEAAWVAAVARARLGQPDRVVAALEIAASGDWSKWGERSLELAALAEFRASPAGRGWVEAGEAYRGALAAALARSLVVLGRSPSTVGLRGRPSAELYAVDLGAARWLRLTHSGGTVVGALSAGASSLVAYVAHRPVARGAIAELRIGVVDLNTGKTGREIVLREVRELALAWRPRAGEQRLIATWTTGTSKQLQSADLDWKHGKRATIDKARPLRSTRLEVDAEGAIVRRLPVTGVTADWDERGTASAIRLDQTGKVVAAPGGALIDGDSVVLSPDGARLVFAVAAEPPCAADDVARLYVADVATGRVRKLASGAVSAAQWLDDDRVAFASGDAVTVAAAATGKASASASGGAGVTTLAVGAPRRCDPPPPPFADGPDLLDGPEADPLDEDWSAPDAGPAAAEPDAATTDPTDAGLD